MKMATRLCVFNPLLKKREKGRGHPTTRALPYLPHQACFEARFTGTQPRGVMCRCGGRGRGFEKTRSTTAKACARRVWASGRHHYNSQHERTTQSSEETENKPACAGEMR